MYTAMYQDTFTLDRKIVKLINECNKTIASLEYHSGGFIDAVVKFLRALKEAVVGNVMKFLRMVGRALSYDTWIMLRNSTRAKRLGKMYDKLDDASRKKIDDTFKFTVMSNSWNKENFEKVLTDFNQLCGFGTDTFTVALKYDISALTNEKTTWESKMSDLDSYGVKYDPQTNKFSRENKYEVQSGLMFQKLGFNSMKDVFNLVGRFESVAAKYRELVKLPNILREIDYQLTTEISNITHDPAANDDQKKRANILAANIRKGISAVKQYITIMRSFCSSINIYLSGMLNRCRQILTHKVAKPVSQVSRQAQEEQKEEATESLWLKEVVTTISTDKEFNERLTLLQQAQQLIRDIIDQSGIPGVSWSTAKMPMKHFSPCIDFCKKKYDFAIILTQLHTTEETPEGAVANLMTEINSKLNELSAGLSTILNTGDKYIDYFRIYYETNAPDMEYLMDSSTLLCW